MSHTGPLIPYESNGTGAESGDNADQSGLGGSSAYEAALQAKMRDGILAGLFLFFSAGLGKTRDWGSRRYYDLLASKAWYFKGADAQVEAGYSGQWDGGSKRLNDNAWAKASRDFPISESNSIGFSFEVAATRQGSRADRLLRK